MKQNKFVLTIAMICLFTFQLTVLAQDQKHEEKKTTSQKMTMDVYACPMHPEVTSDKPGKCPKCKMNLVKKEHEKMDNMSMSDSSHHEQMMGKLSKEEKKTKMKMMMDGKYKCCIEEACDVCVKHGGCNCREAVKNNKPVCGECYQGWKDGKGDVSGKTLKDIKQGHKH